MDVKLGLDEKLLKLWLFSHIAKGSISFAFLVPKLKKIGLKESLIRSYGKDTFQFSTFLTSLSLIFKLSHYSLCKIRGKNDTINLIIAAGLSSIALFIDNPERRKEVSVYVFARSLFSLFNYISQTYHIKLFNGWEILLFCFFGGIFQYSFVYEADTLHSSVYNLLFRLSDYKAKQCLDFLKKRSYESSVLFKDKEQENTDQTETIKEKIAIYSPYIPLFLFMHVMVTDTNLHSPFKHCN